MDSSTRNWLFLFWRAISSGYRARAILWALTLYVLLGVFSSTAARAADICEGVWPYPTSSATIFATVSPAADGNYYNFYCAGTTTLLAECGVSNFDNRVTVIADNGDCHFGLSLNNTCESEGLTLNPVTGMCDAEPPDPCGDAPQDDFIINESIPNPGLCDVGDSANRVESLCQYSESANANCTISVNETVQYLSDFPDNIAYTLNASYGTTSCDPIQNSSDWEFTPCDDPPAPPPTCPEGYRYNTVSASCEAPSDIDGETPTDTRTSSRETTTTETSSSVTNPDGSVTTTTTTTTEIGDCPPGETCIGGIDYEGPGELETKTFAESLTAFWDDIQNAGLVNAVSNIADTVPESPTCPTWTSDNIPIVDSTYTLDGHCIAIAGHEDTIRALMLAVFSIMALFILMSA